MQTPSASCTARTSARTRFTDRTRSTTRRSRSRTSSPRTKSRRPRADMSDRTLIEEAFADRSKLKDGAYAQAVERTIALLDKGEIRVASPPDQEGGEWTTHAWI